MQSGVKYLFIAFWLVPSLCLALDGWESIKGNDHKEARRSFLKQLEKDSTDISALKGLIVLSEMEQDKLSYNKYVNALINKEKNPFMNDLSRPAFGYLVALLLCYHESSRIDKYHSFPILVSNKYES